MVKRKILRSKDGVALLTVVLIFFVLVSLLGGTAILSHGNMTNSTIVRQHTAAFYAAESGVTIETESFLDELNSIIVPGKSISQVSDDIETYINLNNNKSISLQDNQGNPVSADISLELIDDDENNRFIIVIHSIGYVGSQTRTTTKEIFVTYTPGGDEGDGFVIDKAVLVKQTINMDGGHVYGNPVGTYSTNENAIYVDWGASVPAVQIPPGSDKDSVVGVAGQPGSSYNTFITNGGKEAITYLEDVFEFPEIVLPEYNNVSSFPMLPGYRMPGTSFDLITDSGDFNHASWTANQTYVIPNTSDIYYVPSMVISNNSSFTINVGNSDKTLIVDRLVINGPMQVVGNGTLSIFVTSNENSPANSPAEKLSYGYTGGNGYVGNITNPEKVKFFIDDVFIRERIQGNNYRIVPMTVTIGGDSPLYISLMASNLNLNLTGSGKIDGFVITGGESINISGGSSTSVTLYYAPNAHVELTGSGSIRGAILSDSFASFGGSTVYYDDVAFDNFPFQVFDPVTGGTGSPTQQLEIIEGPIIED